MTALTKCIKNIPFSLRWDVPIVFINTFCKTLLLRNEAKWLRMRSLRNTHRSCTLYGVLGINYSSKRPSLFSAICPTLLVLLLHNLKDSFSKNLYSKQDTEFSRTCHLRSWMVISNHLLCLCRERPVSISRYSGGEDTSNYYVSNSTETPRSHPFHPAPNLQS